MNKMEFIEALATHTGVSKSDAEKAVNGFVEVVMAQLKSGQEVNITGFGNFSVTERAARQGVNPKTGQRIQIAATKSPKFKAGKGLKDAVRS